MALAAGGVVDQTISLGTVRLPFPPMGVLAGER